MEEATKKAIANLEEQKQEKLVIIATKILAYENKIAELKKESEELEKTPAEKLAYVRDERF